MSTNRIVVLVLVGAAVVIGLLAMLGVQGTSGAREDVRLFMSRVSERDFASAHGMLHPSLQEELPLDQMRAALANVAVYAEVSFSSFNVSTSTGTQVGGTAVTASGCESPLSFTFQQGLITHFKLEEICTAEDHSAGAAIGLVNTVS